MQYRSGTLIAMVLSIAILAVCSFTGSAERGFEFNQSSRKSGFSLEHAIVPTEHFRRGGVDPEVASAIDMPRMLDSEQLAELNFDLQQAGNAAFITPEQRVVGIDIDGDSRAYGLNMLSWHGIVNDIVGGMPVAVVYCPLSDAVTVLERTIDGETLEFAASGLLYNSNILICDRTAERKDASLWSQLQGRAVTGVHAEAGSTLRMLPCSLTSWDCWLARHPSGRIAAGEQRLMQEYATSPYEQYYHDAKLWFPAWPILPESSPLHAMDKVIALQSESRWIVFPERELRLALTTQSWLEVDGMRFSLASGSDDSLPGDVLVETVDNPDPQMAYAFWFAWYAMQPESEIFPVLD